MQTSASHKIAARYVAPGEVISRWRPFIFVEGTKGRRLIVYWRRLGLYLVTLGLIGWFAAAGVLLALLQSRHHFSGLSYGNLALPWRWDEHRRTLGRHYLALGRQELAENNLGEAMQKLRIGLRHSPAETEARLQLADLYARIRQPRLAADLLLERFGQEQANLPYIKRTLELLAGAKQDAAIIRLAHQHLPATPASNQPQQYFALQWAQALFRQGNYGRATEVLQKWGLDQSADGIVLFAQGDLECGYPQLAITRLQAGNAAYPGHELISLTLLRAYLQIGQREDAHRIALERYAADPFSPGPRIDLLYLPALKENPEVHARKVITYLAEFAGNERALGLLSHYAIDTENTALARQTRITAEAAGHPAHYYRLAEIECLIRNGEYADALEVIILAMADPTPRFDTLLLGYRAVVADKLNDTTSFNILDNFFAARPAPEESVCIASLFHHTGQAVRAGQILAKAADLDPTNENILTRLVRLDIETDNLSGLVIQLPRLIALPKPSRQLLLAASMKITASTPAQVELRDKIKAALDRTHTRS